MSSSMKRRTAEQVLDAIRKAVWEQFIESGYASITFAGIARRSGVVKPVLYRRYSDRATMVYDAILSSSEKFEIPAPTGSLRSDLIVWYTRAESRVSAVGLASYRGLIGEANDQILEMIRKSSRTIAQKISTHVIEPARQRGELGPLPLDAETIYTPSRLMRDRAVFEGELVDIPAFVDAIVLPLFRGASGWVPEASDGRAPKGAAARRGRQS
ncbi:MAG: TetR/AcrR family transcriptional regulator [Pseudoxanthomonas sp.]